MIWSDSVPTALTILGLTIVAGLIAAMVRQASLKYWGNVASLAVAAVCRRDAPVDARSSEVHSEQRCQFLTRPPW